MRTMSLHHRVLHRYATFVVGKPHLVLLGLLLLGALGLWGTSRLTINSNQLDLISQDLSEVKDVKRLIDMVGGSGYLMLALRSEQEDLMKKVADDLAARLSADHNNVRSVTYRLPVEFVQEKMVLFVDTADLLEAKGRIDTFWRAKARQSNPFYLQLRDVKEPELRLDDLRDKYARMGKKSILDDYYISEDRKMLMLLIKPLWDTNELGRTRVYLEQLGATLAAYSHQNDHGVRLVEDYRLMGDHGTIAYGFTGSYKTTLDDSFAIANSLEPVSVLAFAGIMAITVLFFRFKWLPSLVVLLGVVLGTVLTLGFTYATVGQLNMITSILGGILMGFGVDYGIHFIFRTRIELGLGKPFDVAIRDALVCAGRPAAVAAVVTGGSFM
ncbi:MAG: export protein, partial [Deltaproteobacteria bacterium]